MKIDLLNRYGSWALITGATSGIGLAIARIVAENGVNVVLVARNKNTLKQTAEALEAEYSIKTRAISADLTDAAATLSVIDQVKDLDIGLLVPCAAIETSGYYIDTGVEQHKAIAQMDMLSPMTLIHHFGGLMAARKKGAILILSSMSGLMPQPYMAHYGAVKAYIAALGTALYEEMKDCGVDVAVLAPGPTDTPMSAATGIDFKSMGMSIMQPEDVAMTGLLALGKRSIVVPSFRNKMMVFMMARLMPTKVVSGMFKKMMGKALKIHYKTASPLN